MRINIEIKGFGGQGINKLADTMSLAALKENSELNVAAGQDYDSVVRGGISNSLLIISEEEILNPIPEKGDLIIDVNQHLINWTGDLGIGRRTIDASEAMIGTRSRQKGMFLLGVAISLNMPFLKREHVEAVLSEVFKADVKTLGENIKAFREGLDFGSTFSNSQEFENV